MMIKKKTVFSSILFLSCFLFPFTSFGGAPKYIGNKGCSCHKAELTSWDLSAHGRAFDILKPGTKKREKLKAKLDPSKDYTKERKCLKCHTTGYRKKGGFVDLKSTPFMTNVGCESCHGPGSEYRILHDRNPVKIDRNQAKAYGAVYGSEDPKVCAYCHNEKSGHFDKSSGKKYEFDWKKALKNRKSYHRKAVFNKPNFF